VHVHAGVSVSVGCMFTWSFFIGSSSLSLKLTTGVSAANDLCSLDTRGCSAGCLKKSASIERVLYLQFYTRCVRVGKGISPTLRLNFTLFHAGHVAHFRYFRILRHADPNTNAHLFSRRVWTSGLSLRDRTMTTIDSFASTSACTAPKYTRIRHK